MSAYVALTRATYRVYTRDRTIVFFTFVFPLVFLVIFGLAFGGDGASGRPAIVGLTAGIVSWAVASTSLFGAALTMVQWRHDDILRLIRMTPASLSSVLLARYLVALVVAVLQAALFATVAALPPFGLRPAASWPAAVPILAIGVIAFLAIGVVIGCSTDSAEGASAIANCVIVPMAFLSGSFIPLDLMPSWLRPVATLLPLRYLDDGIAAALSGDGDFSDTVLACGALALFATVFTLVGIRRFRWSNVT